MPPRPKSSVGGSQLLTSYGQVIEYIPKRIFLASYTHPPTVDTPFPWPVKTTRSPIKRGVRPTAPTPVQEIVDLWPLYFSIDDLLLYNPFFADFGPLHIGHLYRYAVMLHELLTVTEEDKRPIVFWSGADSRKRANAACMLACYMIMIQNWPPHLALAPIAQMDPPCMPFRDAGYSQADYGLTIQDIVYGVWKAKEEELCTIKDFDLEEYETFERVDKGDFNWITPSFVAFASPQSQAKHVILPGDPLYETLPRNLKAVEKSNLKAPFKNVLCHFSKRNVGLVVRLNSELYSPSYFTALGIKHLDMIFDDGTCPKMSLVRKFINLAHETITVRKKNIAVHCKAGLGRTGCLIGAYLIYRHGFTANEVISFMRFMRPGMVVGPQQHWLHLNQGAFREWWFEDTVKEKLMISVLPCTPTKSTTRHHLLSASQACTPPPQQHSTSHRRSALGEITHNGESHLSASNGTSQQDENLPAPTPGQPRKTNKLYGTGSPIRRANENHRPTTSDLSRSVLAEDDSEEDIAMQLLSASTIRHASRSPASRSGKRRAVSCTTTTMTTTKWDVEASGSDIENRDVVTDEHHQHQQQDAAAATTTKERKTRTPSNGKAGNGLSVGKRNSPVRKSTEGKTSVRKTSGRVGSVGNSQAAVRRAAA